MTCMVNQVRAANIVVTGRANGGWPCLPLQGFQKAAHPIESGGFGSQRTRNRQKSQILSAGK